MLYFDRLQQILYSFSVVLSSVCGTAASSEERRNEVKIAGEEGGKWNLKEKIKQEGKC